MNLKPVIFVAASVIALGLASSPLVAQTATVTSPDLATNAFLLKNGLVIPAFDPVKGRKLFGSKGCVVCHNMNGVGGEDAPDISASHMEQPMNAFDFAAKMWRGAPAMIAMQENELGAQIELTGEELASLIAFTHDPVEQAKFSEADIPDNIKAILAGD